MQIDSYGDKKEKTQPFILFRFAQTIFSLLVSFDSYGAPISFNYKGKKTFQTLPGALMTISSRIFVFGYIGFKIWALIQNDNWVIVSQVTNQEIKDLEKEANFEMETNFTIGF
jgi:hypothetical protein